MSTAKQGGREEEEEEEEEEEDEEDEEEDEEEEDDDDELPRFLFWFFAASLCSRLRRSRSAVRRMRSAFARSAARALASRGSRCVTILGLIKSSLATAAAAVVITRLLFIALGEADVELLLVVVVVVVVVVCKAILSCFLSSATWSFSQLSSSRSLATSATRPSRALRSLSSLRRPCFDSSSTSDKGSPQRSFSASRRSVAIHRVEPRRRKIPTPIRSVSRLRIGRRFGEPGAQFLLAIFSIARL